jgi:hypothetical protein
MSDSQQKELTPALRLKIAKPGHQVAKKSKLTFHANEAEHVARCLLATQGLFDALHEKHFPDARPVVYGLQALPKTPFQQLRLDYLQLLNQRKKATARSRQQRASGK